MWLIHQGNLRPSELQRKIPDVTRRVLNVQLKELEDHELVTKKIYPVLPSRVVYAYRFREYTYSADRFHWPLG
ncbi:winged helix-turn-helix transcriptional regulator [Dyadobacter beijingensis]|uniref:winged helix-turn-helix transcriptional regulator n=1 Tax=Dyadobacter beijingensis TaxID=365489 RepID=UPI001E48E300|nr:winged helix-turn-helix transcriptional regulator [Dyadobacter beijingensis]